MSREAAADLATPEDKAKAINLIVFAATLGAVGGPSLVGLADEAGQSLGLNENVGPYALTVVFFAIGGAIVSAFLRPDPLVLIGGLDSATSPKRASFSESLRIMLSRPLARLALVISQAVMVGVMAMTPLHMDEHGHDVGVIGLVISAHLCSPLLTSAHTAGMFAFAPLPGWFADRFGKAPSIAIGALILVLATTMTALAGEAPKLLMFPGLYLLGLGWSFGMVAGSVLLTESVEIEDRLSVQGAAELLASIVFGVAALESGFVVSMTGFRILSMIGIVASGILLVQGFTRMRLSPLAS